MTLFTQEQLNQMKMLRNEGFTIKRICKIFNCSGPYVVKVCKEESFV